MREKGLSLTQPVSVVRFYWQLSSDICELLAVDRRLEGVEAHCGWRARAGRRASDDTVGITRHEWKREKQPQSRVQDCV